MQRFVPQPAAEALDAAVLHEPTRADAAQMDSVAQDPAAYRLTREFASVVHGDQKQHARFCSICIRPRWKAAGQLAIRFVVLFYGVLDLDTRLTTVTTLLVVKEWLQVV